MKTIDERETQKEKGKNDRKEERDDESIVKGWEIIDFVARLS